MSKHIILTLRNPLDEQDTLDLKFNVLNTTIGNQWFQHCVDNVNSEPRLEKNFCWLGWPDQLAGQSGHTQTDADTDTHP